MISERAVELIADYGRGRWHETEDEEWRLQSKKALADYIASLESQLASLQSRLAAYEEGYDPATKLPKTGQDVIWHSRSLPNSPFVWLAHFDGDGFVEDGTDEGEEYVNDDVLRWFPLPGSNGGEE